MLLNVHKTYNVRVRDFNSTKGGYWRQVPISKELESVLLALKPLTGSTKYVFPRSWEWDKGKPAFFGGFAISTSSRLFAFIPYALASRPRCYDPGSKRRRL
jgi:hypothetical protein